MINTSCSLNTSRCCTNLCEVLRKIERPIVFFFPAASSSSSSSSVYGYFNKCNPINAMSAQLINFAGASGGILVDARNAQFMSENVIISSVFKKRTNQWGGGEACTSSAMSSNIPAALQKDALKVELSCLTAERLKEGMKYSDFRILFLRDSKDLKYRITCRVTPRE